MIADNLDPATLSDNQRESIAAFRTWYKEWYKVNGDRVIDHEDLAFEAFIEGGSHAIKEVRHKMFPQVKSPSAK